MRIALVSPYHPSAVLGGQERIVANLAAGMAKMGHEAEIFSLSREESLRYSRFGHIPVLRLLHGKKWDFSDFEIVNTHGWASELVIGGRCRTPCVATMHGTIAQYMENVKLSPFRKLYSTLTQRRYEQRACDLAANLAALSERQSLEMQQHYGCKMERIRAIGNGIDTRLFIPKQREKSRERLGLPQEKKIVLACARWSVAHKGFDILLKLAERMGKGTALVVNGKTPPGLLRMMKPNMISRTTKLSDMPYLYSAADVFVNPSRYEGFGLVTAEAMACGTPAVAFSTGAAPELIGKNKCGALIRDVRDEDGFVRAALALASEEDLAQEKGRAAAKKGASCTVERMTGKYLSYFREAIG